MITIKFKDLLRKEVDIDMGDTIVDGLYGCLVGPIYLTENGEDYFADILECDVQIDCDSEDVLCWDYGFLELDNTTDWEHKRRLAKKFISYAAGYCNEETWNEYFKDEE